MKDHILIYGVLAVFAASFVFLLNKQSTEIEIVPIPIPSPIPQTVNVPMPMTHKIEHTVQSIVDETEQPPSVKIEQPLTIKPQKLQELQKPINIKKEVPRETEVQIENPVTPFVYNRPPPVLRKEEKQIKEEVRKYKFPTSAPFDSFVYNDPKEFDFNKLSAMDLFRIDSQNIQKVHRYNGDAKLELAFRKFTMVRDDEV
jgi:hypothetical protein